MPAEWIGGTLTNPFPKVWMCAATRKVDVSLDKKSPLTYGKRTRLSDFEGEGRGAQLSGCNARPGKLTLSLVDGVASH